MTEIKGIANPDDPVTRHIEDCAQREQHIRERLAKHQSGSEIVGRIRERVGWKPYQSLGNIADSPWMVIMLTAFILFIAVVVYCAIQERDAAIAMCDRMGMTSIGIYKTGRFCIDAQGRLVVPR